ncbi:MAG: hypothetical protein ABIL58_02870 [Pseudomonadota bacterium]
MKSVKIIFILAVVALFMAGPAAATGKVKGDKGKGHKDKGHKYESSAVVPALLLFPADSQDTALKKKYYMDSLYKKKGDHPFHGSGYVVPAGLFVLDIYNQGTGNRDETAYGVKLVVALDNSALFTSADITVSKNGAVLKSEHLTETSFTTAPATPRFDVSDKAFPRHGVFPAYYAEIGVGDIGKGETVAVDIDVKGDSALLIHFDAYGQGTRYLCDDDCHGNDGKKGHGKKGDCDGKGKRYGKDKHDKDCCEKDGHGWHHDWEACTQTYDIRNKLSHDVTQEGGTSATQSVTFVEFPELPVAQGESANFGFELVASPVTVTALILDSTGVPVAIVAPRTSLPAGDVFVLNVPDARDAVLDGNTVQWLVTPETVGVPPYPFIVTPSNMADHAPLGIYILKICVLGGTSISDCSEIQFEVVTGPQ